MPPRRCYFFPSWVGLMLALGIFLGCSGGSRLQPTVLLISLDGFRWDYLDKASTPYLDRFISTGVKAKSLIPTFPSKTFPNHYSIITGLYPENHGIVSNTMYDPVFDDTFALSIREAVSDNRWYGGEPLWVTAERQGKCTATLFWPGSEASIGGIQPTYWYEYDHSLPHDDRINQVLAWLDLPLEDRPVFITVYFPDTDDWGHRTGVDSPEITRTIARLDSTVGTLFQGLIDRDIMEEANIIIISDHGMTTTDSTRVIFLDDLIDLNQAGVIEWSPILGLWPPVNVRDAIYTTLKNAHPHMQVYRRDEVPPRLHFTRHYRIPPIIGIADEGWSISSHAYYEQDPSSFNGATHGYDPKYPSMHGIFLARGPAFGNGVEVRAFQNIHVYALIAKILGLEPAANDGSLDSIQFVLD